MQKFNPNMEYLNRGVSKRKETLILCWNTSTQTNRQQIYSKRLICLITYSFALNMHWYHPLHTKVTKTNTLFYKIEMSSKILRRNLISSAYLLSLTSPTPPLRSRDQRSKGCLLFKMAGSRGQAHESGFTKRTRVNLLGRISNWKYF